MFTDDDDNYKESNNIGCRLLFISSGTPGALVKNRHPAELGVITRVSSMWCAEGLP